MPTNNSGSVSFPGADGEPVIIEKDEFLPEHPVLLGEPVPAEEEGSEAEGDESPSVGNSSSPSTRTKSNSSGSSNRKTVSR